MNDIEKRAHILNHTRVSCVVGAFNTIYMRGIFGMDPDQFHILSYTNQYFFTFYIMVKKL